MFLKIKHRFLEGSVSNFVSGIELGKKRGYPLRISHPIKKGDTP
jgi:hypothetical protein